MALVPEELVQDPVHVAEVDQVVLNLAHVPEVDQVVEADQAVQVQVQVVEAVLAPVEVVAAFSNLCLKH